MNIVVQPAAFAVMHTLPANAGEAVEMVINILRQNDGRFPGVKEDAAIPDNAPDFIKNSVATRKGRTYREIVSLDGDDGAVLIQWYIAKRETYLWIFNIQHPVNL